MAMLDLRLSGREGRGVPRIVRRIVQRLDVGEADAEQQEHAEQRGEQGRPDTSAQGRVEVPWATAELTCDDMGDPPSGLTWKVVGGGRELHA